LSYIRTEEIKIILVPAADVGPALTPNQNRVMNNAISNDGAAKINYGGRSTEQLSDLGTFAYPYLVCIDPASRSADLLFNMDAFTDRTHFLRSVLAPTLELAETFRTSRHAAIRRYVEESLRPCALLVLGHYA
jgi:hypothetical protein